jgi:hypothetical protein
MGVNLPSFLQPLVENIKSQVEQKAEIKKEDEDAGDE